MESELRSVVLAVVAAAVITPLLGRLLSRAFPPKAQVEDDSAAPRRRLRNVAIEWIGTLFFIVGLSVPFVLRGTDRLEPTATNIALMLSLGALFMVGSVAALTTILGDRNAESFLAYFERRRGISRAGARLVAKAVVVASVIALAIALMLSW